jgi:hypothetical protein
MPDQLTKGDESIRDLPRHDVGDSLPISTTCNQTPCVGVARALQSAQSVAFAAALPKPKANTGKILKNGIVSNHSRGASGAACSLRRRGRVSR